MKRKPAPWPRWAKVLRNLVLFLFLTLTVWTQMAKPLPYEPSLRRMARQCLIPAMEHHAEIIMDPLRDVHIDWSEDVAMSSLYMDPDLWFVYPHRHSPSLHKLTGGSDLLSFPWMVSLDRPDSTPESGYAPYSGYAAYVSLFPPDSSTAATLTLHNNSGTYTVTGERYGEVFVFYAQPEPNEEGARIMDSSWFFAREFTYELTFYDETGKEVAAP